MFMRLGFRPFTSFAKDHYKVLGVSANASKDEIKKAYLGLAKQYHPDTVSGNEEKFKEIANAYETLNNE